MTTKKTAKKTGTSRKASNAAKPAQARKAPAKKKAVAKKAPQKKRGRPTAYSQAMADRICEKIVTGKSLRKVCASSAFPSRDTVCRWLAKYPDFSDQYAHAARTRALASADEILDIADDKKMEPGHKRIMIDTRKWLSARMVLKLYGDKVELDHKGDSAVFVALDDIRQRKAAE